MIWLYILIYFLGAIGTGIIVYIQCIKQYLKEQSKLSFSDWINCYEIVILFTTIFWFMALPIWIIICIIKTIIKKK